MSRYLRGFLFLVALVLFLTSFYLAYTQMIFVQNAKRAKGTIVNYIERCSGSDFDNCDTVPKIEFITDTGEKITFVNRLSSKITLNSAVKHEYIQSATVNILYDQLNPQNARVDSFMDRWFLPIFTFTTSMLLLMFIKLAKNQ